MLFKTEQKADNTNQIQLLKRISDSHNWGVTVHCSGELVCGYRKIKDGIPPLAVQTLSEYISGPTVTDSLSRAQRKEQVPQVLMFHEPLANWLKFNRLSFNRIYAVGQLSVIVPPDIRRKYPDLNKALNDLAKITYFGYDADSWDRLSITQKVNTSKQIATIAIKLYQCCVEF